MDKELNKLIGFTVETYPTLRSEREPMLPIVTSYQVFSMNEINDFANASFCSLDIKKGQDTKLFNIINSCNVWWKRYLTAEKIKELSQLDYYTNFIWMHMKISYIYVSEDTTEEECIDLLRKHAEEKLHFDTEEDHFAHNEFGVEHVAKPVFIIVDKMHPVNVPNGYYMILMEHKISLSDWYAKDMFPVSVGGEQ